MPPRWVSADQLAGLLGPPPLRRPAYQDLAGRLRMLVVDGRLDHGVRVPGERDLADALRLSRSTVAAAYAALRTTGQLRARQGSGHYVHATAPVSQLPGGVREVEGAITLTFSAAGAAPGVGAAYQRAMAQLPGLLTGHGYSPAGLPLLRARLADWFSARGLPTEPDQLVVTSGGLAALNLALDALLGPGDRVLVEAPSYANALESLRRHGARLVPAPLGRDGWDVTEFAAAARQSAPRLAYLVPDFHNPTGQLMSSETRARLAAVLRAERCTPVVDETLVEVNPDGLPMPDPFAVSHPGTVTLGSASKAFWGGLRIGWVRGPQPLVAEMVRLRSTVDLGAAPLEQLVLAELLVGPEADRLEHRQKMGEQRDQLLRLLADRLPDWKVLRPAGGQTVWIELPRPVSTPLVARAATEGLILTPGQRFFPAGGGERHLRLPFTAEPSVLTDAVDRLARSWAAVATAGRPDELTG